MRNALVLGAMTVAAGIVGFVRPGFRLGAATTWGLSVLVYGLIWSGLQVRGMAAHGRSPLDQILRPPVGKRSRPADLVRCERIFGQKVYTPTDFDHSIRPTLRTLIHHRLALDRDGAGGEGKSADGALDDELTGLIGKAPAEALYGRDLVTADIERMLGRIEVM